MDKLTIPKEVVDGNGTISTVVSVVIQNAIDGALQVKRDAFLDTYTEYVDPKDVEINRLLAIIKDLEKPKHKHVKKRLSKGEWKEVEELIRSGAGNTEIANEYGISDSGVSKRRTSMRMVGEEV